MLTSGTTGPPKRVDLTYETLERVLVGAKHYESQPRRRPAAALGRGRRQLAARAPRRPVPGAAVRQRRPLVLLLERFRVDGWVDAVRRHRPATASLVPDRAAHGAGGRPRPRRPGQPAVGRLGHRAARPRRRRRVHDAVRRARCSISYAATEFGGGVAGWNIDDHRAVLGDEAGERRPGPRRLRAARRRRRHRASRSAVDAEGLLEVKAGQLGDGGLGAHHRPGPASTPTGSSGSSAAPTRRSSAAASRSCPRTCGPRSSGTRRCGAPRWCAATTAASAPCRSRPSSCARDAGAVGADDLLADAGRGPRPLRAADRDPHRRRAAPHRLRQGRPRRRRPAPRRRHRRGLTVDLRYSEADEAFRTEVRAWLDEAVPAYGPPPPPGDWDGAARLRHRVAAAAPRRRLRRAATGRSSTAAAACPPPSSSCTSRSTPPSGAPYVGINFVGIRPRRSDADRRGHRGAAPLPPAPDPPGRERLVPGLLRARGRVRPRLAAHPGGARRRRVRRHRPEDLEHPGPRRRLLRAARAHRSRRARSTRASPG